MSDAVDSHARLAELDTDRATGCKLAEHKVTTYSEEIESQPDAPRLDRPATQQ